MENEVIYVGLTIRQLETIWKALGKMPSTPDVIHADLVIGMALRQAQAGERTVGLSAQSRP